MSIAALFTGGMLPALVLGLCLCTVVWWRYRKEDLSGVTRYSKGQIGRFFVIALPAIALPFVIRAAVVEGVATATEVSTIGVVYSVIAGLLVYRQFDWRRLKPMLIETASLSGAIMFIVGCATAMAWGLTQSGFSTDLARWMAAIPGGSYASSPFRSSPSSCWAACSKASRPSCCSGRCCFPSRRPPAYTRCTTRWS